MYGPSTTITPGPEQIFKRHSSTQRTWQRGQFGKLFQYSVDSPVFAQPLVISNVTVPGKGIRNVLYLATADNTIYAYDADDPTIDAGQPIWKVRFSDPTAGVDDSPEHRRNDQLQLFRSDRDYRNPGNRSSQRDAVCGCTHQR